MKKADWGGPSLRHVPFYFIYFLILGTVNVYCQPRKNGEARQTDPPQNITKAFFHPNTQYSMNPQEALQLIKAFFFLE